MHIEYIDGPPTDAQENAVIKAGYRWARTNTLGPGGRLGMHGHSVPNTHLIVAGSLQFENSVGKSKYCRSREDVVENPELAKNVLDEADPAARKEIHVPGHNFYQAVTSEGATFVEGHRPLSPQTAERFIDRGTLRIVPDEGKTAWPEQAVLQKLLREAKWFPRGEQGLSNTLKPVMRWKCCNTAANRSRKSSLGHRESPGPFMHAFEPFHSQTPRIAFRGMEEDNEAEADPWRTHRMTTRRMSKAKRTIPTNALSHDELGIANAKEHMCRFFIAEWEQKRPEPQVVDDSGLYHGSTVIESTDDEETASDINTAIIETEFDDNTASDETDLDDNTTTDETDLDDCLETLHSRVDMVAEVVGGDEAKVSAVQRVDKTASSEEGCDCTDERFNTPVTLEVEADPTGHRRASLPMVKSYAEAWIDWLRAWCDEAVAMR